MPRIPDFVIDKGVDVAIEVGSEAFAEIFADYVLGRRGQQDPTRHQLIELLKGKDKEAAKNMIKANQQGIGLGDEQIMENDIAALPSLSMIDARGALALTEFFYSQPVLPYCLNQAERSVYRRAHILETDVHIRRRNLMVLANMATHRDRRRHVGASGKLDKSMWDQFNEPTTDAAGVQRIADLRADTAAKKARVLGTQPNRTGWWHRFKVRIGYERY